MTYPRATSPDRLQITAIAREHGLTVPRALAILQSAAIFPDAAKCYDVIDAALAIEFAKSKEVEDPRSSQETKPTADANENVARLADQKIESERWRAEKLRLAVLREQSLFIPREDVEAAAQETLRRVRSSMLAIPRNVAPQLLNLSDPLTVAAILEAEIRRCLGGLSTFEKALADVA